MITNILLYGLADTIAQTIVTVKSVRLPLDEEAGLGTGYTDDDPDEDEHVEMFMSFYQNETNESRGQENTLEVVVLERSPQFNFWRLTMFMVYGFLLSFVQQPWYYIVNHIYDEKNVIISSIMRVLTDQLCFSPLSLCAFFVYTTIVIEGGSKSDVEKKLKSKYVTTLGINYMVWPLAQFINFALVPPQLMLPFSSAIGVFWTAFLCYRNAK
ncbi:Vacuolar membrane protein [Yarrowia sp. E02]|nr:Vacuolar membrane protein [Yarrowia sp. E02]